MPVAALSDRVHRTVEAVWRIESARLIAGLARVTGDVALAEDLAGTRWVVEESGARIIFPDIAGDSTRRSEACDAVMPQPFRGGGTLILGGAEVAVVPAVRSIASCR